jgi:hypothetical protein
MTSPEAVLRVAVTKKFQFLLYREQEPKSSTSIFTERQLKIKNVCYLNLEACCDKWVRCEINFSLRKLPKEVKGKAFRPTLHRVID